MPASACPGCGIEFESADGPTHPYMVSSPECWASFGRLQADELQRFGYPPMHGLGVDAFASSHGGDGAERRDRQSVAIHLLALRAVLRGGEPSEGRIAMLRRLTTTKRDWPKLERPPGFPEESHLVAIGAADLAAYTERVREWADSVFGFWAPVHPQLEQLASEVGVT